VRINASASVSPAATLSILLGVLDSWYLSHAEGSDQMRNANKFYINGEWVTPLTSETCEVINPATEEPIASIALGGKQDVDAAVSAAKTAFTSFLTNLSRRTAGSAWSHHRRLQSEDE